MNLINDRWIPIRRADGSTGKIAPWEITQDIYDEKKKIIAVASPRPDFDGALIQFLIGLLQTACTPETEDVWWDWQVEPPLPDTLKGCFKPYDKAFNLYENKTTATADAKPDNKLFMQELLASNNRARLHPVSYLLIDASTDNALKTNTDHFQKRPKLKEVMCKDCAAAALYTLQTFASSGGGGGDGKATSLRGGGPLSTIILGDNLWETVWMNVIVNSDFGKRQYNERTFPWLNIEHFIRGTTQVKTIHSQKMNPEHVFWGMPRRIQLDFSTFNNPKTCSICGSQNKFMCQGFLDLTGGLTYQHKQGNAKNPSWINPLHPLSPYTLGKNGIPSAVHQHGRIGYRYWLGFIENVTTGNIQRIPAKVIQQFHTIVRKDGQLWAFGFDMDNAKARCWYDSKMPILIIAAEQKEAFRGYAEQLIQSANWFVDNLSKQIKKALFGETEIPGNFAFIKALFWHQTENIFYQTLHQLRDALLINQPVLEIKLRWCSKLSQEALAIFDEKSQTGDFDAVDPGRIANARNELCSILYGEKVKKILGLPIEKTERKKR
jgi:CRISPR system Cascade subunit CasA